MHAQNLVKVSKHGANLFFKVFYNTRMCKSNSENFLDVVNFWSRCVSTVNSYYDTVQNKILN